MNETLPRKSWWGRNWKWVVPTGGCLIFIILIIVFIGTLFFGLNKFMTESTPYEEAFTKAIENEQVIEALGEPIEQEGLIQGSLNYENDRGEIDVKVPLEGPKGIGYLYIKGTKDGENWDYSDLYVIIESTGETIFLLNYY